MLEATIDTPTSHEIGNSSRLLELKFTDERLAQTHEGRIARIVIEHLNTVIGWAKYRFDQSLPEDPDEGTKRQILADIGGDIENITSLSILMVECAGISKLPSVGDDPIQLREVLIDVVGPLVPEVKEHDILIEELAKLGMDDLLDYLIEAYDKKMQERGHILQFPDQVGVENQFLVIPIQDEHQSRHFLGAHLKIWAHDIKGPLTAVRGMALLAWHKPEFYPGYRPRILAKLETTPSVIKELVSAFVGEMDEKTMPVHLLESTFSDKIVPEFINHGLDSQNISLAIPENIPADTLMSVQPILLQNILLGILENSAKIYRAKAAKEDTSSETISGGFRITLRYSNEPNYLEIICDDDGPGIPKKILDLGFVQSSRLHIHGYENSSISSSGFGMANYTSLLQEKGGDIIPTNRVGEDCSTQGARIIIRIPIQSQ